MKVAIVGSHFSYVEMDSVIPRETTLLISGETEAFNKELEIYADAYRLPVIFVKRKYNKIGNTVSLVHCKQVVDLADYIIIIWEEQSREILYTMKYAEKVGKPVKIFHSKNKTANCF